MRKRPSFIRLTECNSSLLAVLPWNNCVRYVENQRVSMYMGAYVTKHCRESEQCMNDVLRVLTRHYEETEALLALLHQVDIFSIFFLFEFLFHIVT